MWARFPLHAEYVASLPVAGQDGTIRWRMEGGDAVGRVRAKTGTLEGVTTLSGYVETAARRTLAFSILVNDFPGRASAAIRAVDAMGTALAASGGTPGAVGAAVALAKGAPAESPAAAPADLAASVRTYYALGRAGDARNLPFLRTALRTETEPALRLAVAECVLLSDPDGDTSRRTFLDAVPSDPQVLLRLWAAADAGPPAADAPVLLSLGDIAAEGNAEALSRLVELAPAAALDARLAASLAQVLTDVAATAPDELVAALRAASEGAQEAAVGVLGSGLARAEERAHPFPAALRAIGERQDETGAFARALKPRLDAATTAGAAARGAPALVPATVKPPVRAPGGG
jgi:D-alanyl-D-alanine carboxypeptidase/D-alanyl-D-alanine-endopeptidase (penicillin-binding protein 4)